MRNIIISLLLCIAIAAHAQIGFTLDARGLSRPAYNFYNANLVADTNHTHNQGLHNIIINNGDEWWWNGIDNWNVLSDESAVITATNIINIDANITTISGGRGTIYNNIGMLAQAGSVDMGDCIDPSPGTRTRWDAVANNITHYTAATVLGLNPAGSSAQELWFASPAGFNVKLAAPATMSANYTLTWPTAQGSTGTFLQNDGSGNLSWASGGGGGGTNWSTASHTATGSYTQSGGGNELTITAYDTIRITDSASDTVDFTPGKTYAYYSKARGTTGGSDYYSYFRQNGAGNAFSFRSERTSAGTARVCDITGNAAIALSLSHTAEIQLYSPGVTMYDYTGLSRGKLNFVDSVGSAFRASLWAPTNLKHTYILSLPDTMTAGYLYGNSNGNLSFQAGGVPATGKPAQAYSMSGNSSADWNDALMSGWFPSGGGSTNTSTIGITIGANGSPTGASITATSAKTSARRITYNSASASNASGGIAGSQPFMLGGNASYMGGWRMVVYFSPSTLSAQTRLIIGATATFNNSIDPSAFANIAAIGADGTDTNLQFITRGASGSATKTDLGIAKANTTTWYRATIWTTPNSGIYYWELFNMDTRAVVSSGSHTTNLPVNTTPLSPYVNINTGGFSASAAIDIGAMRVFDLMN